MTSVAATTLAAAPLAAASAQPAAADNSATFDDLIDIVNPLQHIPIVSTLYRAITGDTIKTFPKIAGDTLYGGVMGFASSMADTIFTKITGKSVGDTALAFAEDMFSPSNTPTAVATADAPAAPAAASVTVPVGEDLGDRIVGWIENLFSPSDTATPAAPAAAAASAAQLPAPAMPATPLASDAIVVPGQDALLLAMSRNGVSQDVALRAADAYRRTLNVADTAAAAALH